MKELTVGLGERSYPIRIEYGCLNNIGKNLIERRFANRYCIIADDTVASLYGDRIVKSLEESGVAAELISFKAGEASKTLATYGNLLSGLAQRGFERKDGIIALGGGVTGDLAGFVAASYMRGIPFVQIPTTLLSQVDSSVGGKTGVDILEGKNLVGAFYQPKAVYIDTNVLETLPRGEILGGMGEVIKYGIIRDRKFFDFLRDRRQDVMQLDGQVIEKILYTSCTIKAEVVAEDEQESDIRRILNYGHTIGHAVEAVSNFSIIHGKAVAIGMVSAARLALYKGILSEDTYQEIFSLLVEYGLPTEIPQDMDRNRIKQYIVRDKKAVAGRVAYVLPVNIGEVIITDDVDEALLDNVLG